MFSKRLIAAALILVGLLVARMPVEGATLKSDLKIYVERLTQMYPGAVITSGFYDWRGLSRYRSNPGLHLGYDIALDAGTPVPAGWSGRVVDVIPWSDGEWGVAVESANGYRVTYGHLSPTIGIGAFVQPGTIVGTVVWDHVDIKVKDRTGGYLDFGQTYGVLDGSSPWAQGGAAGLLPPPPGDYGASAGVSIETLYEKYRDARTTFESRKVERDRVQRLVSALSEYIDRESVGLPESESQLLAMYRAADNNQISSAQVEAFSLQVTSRRKRVNRLCYVMEARQAILAEREVAYRIADMTLDNARRSLDKASADAARVKKIDDKAALAGQKASPPTRSSSITARYERARSQMLSAKDRYAQGAMARTDWETAERNFERWSLVQTLYEHGDKDAAYGLSW